MKKTVYRFLDAYLGDEVTCIKSFQNQRYDTYSVHSKKNKSLILSFNVNHKEGDIAIFRGNKLNDTVSSFFNLNPESTMSIIRDWFADKHDINKVKDLMKFVN